MIQRMLFLPYTFVLLNWAAVRGLLLYLRGGGLDHVWKDVHHHHGVTDRRHLHPSKP